MQYTSVAKGSCWKLKSTNNLNYITIAGMYITGWLVFFVPQVNETWGHHSADSLKGTIYIQLCLCSLVPIFDGEESWQIFSLGLPQYDTIMWNLGNVGSGLCHAYNIFSCLH